jgi:hypothetical protein
VGRGATIYLVGTRVPTTPDAWVETLLEAMRHVAHDGLPEEQDNGGGSASCIKGPSVLTEFRTKPTRRTWKHAGSASLAEVPPWRRHRREQVQGSTVAELLKYVVHRGHTTSSRSSSREVAESTAFCPM